MLAVTTFSADGYREYAQTFLESYAKYWPIKLIAFYEEKPEFSHALIEYRSFYDIPETKALKRIRSSSDGDYRFNAYKFCRKVFAQNALFDETDKLFWIDADCVCLLPMMESFLEELVQDVALCFMGRSSYTETGFIGFNTKHHDFGRFRDNYVIQYTEGRIFSQKEWHDCIAFDLARKDVEGRNLTEGGHGMEHVILTSPLAKYLDHLKGGRKEYGYSPGHPYHKAAKV